MERLSSRVLINNQIINDYQLTIEEYEDIILKDTIKKLSKTIIEEKLYSLEKRNMGFGSTEYITEIFVLRKNEIDEVLRLVEPEINKIKEIVYKTRRTGNSTWILKAAIKQPKCVIVSKNMEGTERLKKEYFKLLSNKKWYQKIYDKWFGDKTVPLFLSINSRFEGLGLPLKP